MIRFNNIESESERAAFLAQIGDYARSLTKSLADLQPNDLTWCSAVRDAEEYACVSCQLLRYLQAQVHDGEIQHEEALKVATFAVRILEAIKEDSSTREGLLIFPPELGQSRVEVRPRERHNRSTHEATTTHRRSDHPSP